MWIKPRLVWLALVALSSCTAPLGESVSPVVENFTETDAAGNILRVDPDDWRIQERFRNEVRVRPAFPNPTPNGIVSLIVEFSASAPIGRIDVLTTNTAGNPIFVARLDALRAFGIEFYRINLTPVAVSGNLSEVRGRLFRLRLLDPFGNLITYGDVKFAE
ncbi:MAG: hypothetical protein RMI34_07695 [Chloroherpetonaceae bacterium]|nr:hypothetical protein [Chloroherpetonaceae bacterium]MCS7211476.1 hypothetical protein [Chloroherpetonaceae bacterium]MDW8019942.1 hypothetical protein [Chloroherpetonaceae bacterium]MDW8465748.1 hypothetical protein [Chloroherpetonaceae bacterium]